MRVLRSILRYFLEMPRGHAADGRVLGLATASAIESTRRGESAPGPEDVVPEPRRVSTGS